MGSKTAKIIYVVTALALLSMALYPQFAIHYIDDGTRDAIMYRYLWLMILIAVIVGFIYFILLKKIFPVGYKRQAGWVKVILPLMFMCIAYGVTRGMATMINSFFPKESLLVQGRVTKKYKERLSRLGSSFYLNVSDTIINKPYHFEITGEVFRRGREGVGDIFNKEFSIGCFGIIFRKEL